MDIFYSENLLDSSEEIIFSPNESKHIIRVLRKNIGDKITVTNGKGLEWIGLISSIDIKHARAKKSSITLKSRPDSTIHVGISPTKNSSRLDWFIEKVSEIGVNEITPIICNNSIRKSLNKDRCQKIMISAIKQSRQLFIPKLNPIISFTDFIELDHSDSELYIAHCHEMKKNEIHQLENINNKITVMIGPEGDFSIKELESVMIKGGRSISLGSNRLRTETAGILAVNNFFIQQHILNS